MAENRETKEIKRMLYGCVYRRREKDSWRGFDPGAVIELPLRQEDVRRENKITYGNGTQNIGTMSS